MTIDASGNIVRHRNDDVDRCCQHRRIQFPASTLPQALPFQSTPRAPIQFFVTKVNTTAAEDRQHRLLDLFWRSELRHDHAGCGGRRHRCRYQRQRLLHGHHELHLYRVLGMQQHRLSHPECLPALSGSGASGDDRQSSIVLEYDDTTATRTRLWPSSIPTPTQGEQLIWSTYVGGTRDRLGNGSCARYGSGERVCGRNHELHRHWTKYHHC